MYFCFHHILIDTCKCYTLHLHFVLDSFTGGSQKPCVSLLEGQGASLTYQKESPHVVTVSSAADTLTLLSSHPRLTHFLSHSSPLDKEPQDFLRIQTKALRKDKRYYSSPDSRAQDSTAAHRHTHTQAGVVSTHSTVLSRTCLVILSALCSKII